MNNADDARRLTPEAAFSVLGNETRIDILQALWESEEPLAYSDLQRHVGIRDSGRFNYHLGELLGVFVTREDDAYHLRETGNWLIRSLLAGTITEEPSFDSVALDVTCPRCGANAVEASYEDDILTVRCTAHGGAWNEDDNPEGLLYTLPFPPAGLAGRTPEEVAQTGLTWMDVKSSSMERGFCLECAGRVTRSVEVICQEHLAGLGRACPNCDSLYAVRVDYACEHCGYPETVPTWVPLLKHPTVVSFFHDRGLTSTDWSWEVYSAIDLDRYREEIRSLAPIEIGVTLPVGDDELQMTLDGELNVLDVTVVED